MCGSTTAQLIASIRRRASRTPCSGRRAREPAGQRQRGDAAAAHAHQRQVLRVQQDTPADADILQQHGPDHRHDGNRQRRHEQPVAQPRGARPSRLFGRRGRVPPLAHGRGPRSTAIATINRPATSRRQALAQPGRRSAYRPQNSARRERPRVAAVAQGHEGARGEQQADQHVERIQRRRSSLPSRCCARCRPRSSRGCGVEPAQVPGVDQESRDRGRDAPHGHAQRIDLQSLGRARWSASARWRRTRRTRPRRRTGRRCPWRRSWRGCAGAWPRRACAVRVARLGRRFGHRRDQRPHHVRMAAQAGQAEGGRHFAHQQINRQQPSRWWPNGFCAMLACACSFRPARSSRPIAASGSRRISGRLRVLMKRRAERFQQVRHGQAAATPVTPQAAITTSTGLARSRNPATTTAMPSSGHRLTAVCMSSPAD